MGRSHALTGAAAGRAIATWFEHFDPANPLHLDSRTGWLFTTVCAGAAVLPDIDHPASTVARCLGPLTGLLARIVVIVSGGHRRGTHSAVGAALFTLAAATVIALYQEDRRILGWGAAAAVVLIGSGWLSAQFHPDPQRRGNRSRSPYRTRWHAGAAVAVILATAATGSTAAALRPQQTGAVGAAILLTLTLAAAVRVLHIHGWLDDLLPIPLAAAIVYWHLDLTALPIAWTVGVLVHIAGDRITVQGTPWGFPWSTRSTGLRWIETGGDGEKLIVFVTWLSLILLTVWLYYAQVIAVRDMLYQAIRELTGR